MIEAAAAKNKFAVASGVGESAVDLLVVEHFFAATNEEHGKNPHFNLAANNLLGVLIRPLCPLTPTN